MLRFIPAAALLSGAAVFALCASTYGRQIVRSDSARAAAPLAAPFLLFAGSTGASLALGAASLCNAVDPLRRRS